MRKVLSHNNLRRFPAPTSGRAAFSLAELVISVGILVLMLSLAGQVFNFTVKSTGQATALTKINQRIRLFERTLREDLRGVQPGRSVMIIQGNPVNAYWTKENVEAGTGNALDVKDNDHSTDSERENLNGNMVSPRADTLMFFTARRGRSFVRPEVTSQLQLVTYGVSEKVNYAYDTTKLQYDFVFPSGEDSNGNPNDPTIPVDGNGYPDPAEPTSLPSSNWLVFRRPTLLLATDPSVSKIINPKMLPMVLDAENFERMILAEQDIMGGVSYDQDVLTPDVLPFSNPAIRSAEPWFLPRILTANAGLPLYAPSMIDPTPPPQLADRLGHYFLPRCASFKVEWALDPQSEFVGGRLDGITEMVWFDPGDQLDPSIPGDVADPLRAAVELEKRLADQARKANGAAKEILTLRRNNVRSLVENRWLDDNSTNPNCDQFGFSLEDRFRGPNPPHSNPACGWDQLSTDATRANLAYFGATRPKLEVDPATNTRVWDGTTLVPDPMFPGALRITIDVYDDERRLERPIRHVMIIPIGG